MRLWVLMLLAMTVPAAAETILPGDEVTLSDKIYGCQEAASDKLDEFVSQGDEAAFAKYLAAARKAGACKEFRRGAKLMVTDVSLWSGRAQVRQPGEIDSWWVTYGTLGEVATKSGRAY